MTDFLWCQMSLIIFSPSTYRRCNYSAALQDLWRTGEIVHTDKDFIETTHFSSLLKCILMIAPLFKWNSLCRESTDHQNELLYKLIK